MRLCSLESAHSAAAHASSTFNTQVSSQHEAPAHFIHKHTPARWSPCLVLTVLHTNTRRELAQTHTPRVQIILANALWNSSDHSGR